jgi:hypothetical protein
LICVSCGGTGYIEDGKIASGEQIDKILHRLKKIMQKIDAWEDGD